MNTEKQLINQLSDAQLGFYNQRDIEGFCSCYHAEVQVLDAQGVTTLSGLPDFKERYRKIFLEFPQMGARIESKIQFGPHSVELEHWWRAEESGTVIVRYTLREGKIGWVQFLK